MHTTRVSNPVRNAFFSLSVRCLDFGMCIRPMRQRIVLTESISFFVYRICHRQQPDRFITELKGCIFLVSSLIR